MTWNELKEKILSDANWDRNNMVDSNQLNNITGEVLFDRFGLFELYSNGDMIISLKNKTPDEMYKILELLK